MYLAMRPELLARTNANGEKYLNVITVDWTGGVHASLGQSNGNGRLVAIQISYFLKKLESRGKLSCDDVHIIGFSLGASIAGLVGKAGRKSPRCIIDRITGESYTILYSIACLVVS
jgi:pimeloyl-ACP methyl ester carboxylesterase